MIELALEQTQQGVSYEVSNIRVILLTVKMEILLVPTSNKLMVGDLLGSKDFMIILELILLRYMQRLTSKILIMAIEGNHEIEEQVESTTFAAYSARFAFPSEESADQYKWLQRDLEKVDRGVTLWLVGVWHPPWYNTYVSYYKEVECMRVAMEELLYNAGVDIIFNGHQTWDVIDTTIIKTIVDKLLDPPEEVSADYDEPLRIELLQLATLLLKYLQTDLVHHRKELIKFGWNHLKREDSASKQWAFVNVCHFLKAYQAPEKIILQWILKTTAISNIKLPILKKEEYDIWAMEMEHYLELHGQITAAEIQAVEKERKAKNILLMAIPKEHMRRFHGMDDAKEIWEAIRTRFGGNANSKKMQKAVFKQQFEAFKISNSEGLEKGYDRFQQLLSQLEAHGAEVSTEDANHKFLRSLPPAWSNLAMTMRTNPEIDTLSIDDLYNNLRVFEQEIQGASKTSSSAQNVAFVSQSKSSTNKVKSGFTGAYSTCTPSTSSTNVPEKEVLAGFADEVIYSLFAKQTEDLDLLHEDLEQIDDVDIEEMDINWQIAMIAIRMKKFYKKTGRRVRVDGKTPVGFDKKKLECFNCHNTGHFARECTAKGTHDGKKKRDSLYQHQEAGKQEKNQMGLLTMDDGIVYIAEEKTYELKTLCDEQMNQLGDQEAQILAYSQAVKKLEAQLVTFQKQQLSLNEKLTFQANEIYEKDEKLKRYRRIGMKAVKEKEQLQKTVDSWKDSSKNLWRLIDSGMSSNSKVGLGFEIQSNNEVLSYEEEMNFSVFNCSKEDSIGKPLYSRFTKTNDFKGVPHPLSGDYTPRPQEEIDDSLYVYGRKGPQKPEISVSDDNSSEHSTCQSNDSEGSCGNTSEHSFETESESLSEPNEMSKSRLEVTNEKVVSELQEVEPSCAKHVKTPRQPLKDNETHKVNRKNWNDMMERELGEGYSFTKKKCFVCGSLSHLIKDCDYYEKKMAREAEVRRVVNTGNGVAKPVWTNANRINHSNKFVPRSVQLNAGRPKFNSVRPNINTGRTNINSVSPKVNTVSSNINTVRSRQPVPHKTSNSFSPKRPQMNQINQRRDFSKTYSSVRRPFAKSTAQMAHSNAVMGSWGSAVKTSASYNWRNSRPNSNCDSGPTFIRTEHPLKNMVDRGIFDSGCSGHMTSNKDQLEDFKSFNGGFVTFGGSKGYISGKGKIRVGNLDFDSVSFVKELGHFNLFLISQNDDTADRFFFTETECLIVSSDFKVLDENQILLKVPKHHNMYSFDMKTPTPAKGISEKTNTAGTSQTPKSIASEEKDEEVELIVGKSIRKQLTSTSYVNTSSQTVNTGRLDLDDSPMPELEILHKSETGIFDEASYDEEGVITDFNSLPTEI
ncbi:ribonuclease H-like domain-containing protein [Tanacetum coccineum]